AGTGRCVARSPQSRGQSGVVSTARLRAWPAATAGRRGGSPYDGSCFARSSRGRVFAILRCHHADQSCDATEHCPVRSAEPGGRYMGRNRRQQNQQKASPAIRYTVVTLGVVVLLLGLATTRTANAHHPDPREDMSVLTVESAS